MVLPFVNNIMNITTLCNRIAANDETLTEINAVYFSQEKIAGLLQALEQASQDEDKNHQRAWNVRELILAQSNVTPDSLLRLLSFICRRRQSSDETITSPKSPLQNLQVHLPHDSDAAPAEQNSLAICQQFFQGMASDEPPGLGDLEQLTLESWYWDESSAQALHDAFLSRHCRLTYLRLSLFFIGDERLHLLVTGIMSSPCRLEELHLNETWIGNAGAQHLARLLSHNSNNSSAAFGLLILNLTSNFIQDEGAEALATALQEQCQNHPTLIELNIAHNRIGPDGIVALIKSVTSHPTLTTWSVYQNPIQPDGFYALVEAIPRFQFLKTLMIGPTTSNVDWQRYGMLEQQIAVNHVDVDVQPEGDTDDENQEQLDPEHGEQQIERLLRRRLRQIVQCYRQAKPNFQLHHDAKLIALMQNLAASMEHNRVLETLNLAASTNYGTRQEPNLTYKAWGEYQQLSTFPEKSMLIPASWENHLEAACKSPETFQVLDAMVVSSFFINLNRLGLRDVFLHHDQHAGLWPLILKQARAFPSLIFYMLREQPNLVVEDVVHQQPCNHITKRARLEPRVKDIVHLTT